MLRQLRRPTSTRVLSAFRVNCGLLLRHLPLPQRPTPDCCSCRHIHESVAPLPVGISFNVFHRTTTLLQIEQSFQCSACGKGFRLLSALNHHISTKHAGAAKVVTVGKDGKLSSGPPSSPSTPASSTPSGVKAPTPSAVPTPSGGGLNSAPSSKEKPSTATPTATPQPPLPSSTSFSASSTPQQPLSTAEQKAVDPTAPQPSTVAGSFADAPPQTAAPPAAAATTTSTLHSDFDPATDKKLFVCTICQKTFRLEAALQHHYQAKHHMDMPAVPTSSSSGSTATLSSGGGSTPSTTSGGEASPTADGSSSSTSASSLAPHATPADGSSTLPEASVYNMEVAPNAPLEVEIAAHWRLVNHILLLGTVHDVISGFVFEDPVVQFVCVTHFEGSPTEYDKDHHTVRIYGDDATLQRMKNDVLRDGQRVLISGRIRLVPQFESSTNKFYHFPIVIVQPGTGVVESM